MLQDRTRRSYLTIKTLDQVHRPWHMLQAKGRHGQGLATDNYLERSSG